MPPRPLSAKRRSGREDKLELLKGLARKLALTSASEVAFSRTGEPATGEFEDAVVLRTFGEVPSMEELLSAG